MASIEALIMANMKSKLEELTWQNLVEYEKIRLLSTDFRDHELPAIQFFDSGRTFQHLKGRVEVEWQITIEVVMKKQADDLVDQSVLLDRMEEIERKIGSNVQLDLGTLASSVGSMVHVKYLNAITDLHTLSPFYSGVLNFSANYYKPYVNEC